MQKQFRALTCTVVSLTAGGIAGAWAQTPAPPPPAAPAPVAATDTPDYPEAVWAPASPRNFQRADRPTNSPIDMIVIHDIEGTAESAVRWFENPQARVSAHYVVDGTTGRVYQQVREHDIAWHAGNSQVNARSVGIEHEGFAYRPGFFNPREYEASARLVRWVSARYNIPRDRTHIIGHFEVPSLRNPGQFGGSGGHTDPGPYWDWDYFMALVRNDARIDTAATFPALLHPGETINVDVMLTNVGDDPWPVIARGAPDAAAQRGKGLVFLGVWDSGGTEGAPLGPVTPFYGDGWVSPRLAAAPQDTETAPGATAHFPVSLHGPLAPGTYTQMFRLFKVPVAPHLPVAFGPTLSATIRVEPWDTTVDAGQPGFTAPGWNTKLSPNGTGQIAWLRGGGATQSPAQWQTTLPVGGAWDVYVRWPSGPDRAADAVYQITQETVSPASSSTVQALPNSLRVDQRQNGGQWRKLGRFPLAAKTPVTVRLVPGAGRGTVIADAVRFVGPFPAQTPARTELLTPGPRP